MRVELTRTWQRKLIPFFLSLWRTSACVRYSQQALAQLCSLRAKGTSEPAMAKALLADASPGLQLSAQSDLPANLEADVETDNNLAISSHRPPPLAPSLATPEPAKRRPSWTPAPF
ncbi:hypothetical protein PTTG_06416 [Puccinia triticina 1-1 BBBD Race 1]|uniref:Uncharacterized protein n=1 Tax=Puccinia triticina (isolate 1-1 / race 1 (BBBD)) TaxID=630390 RepID=A0A180G265_PUCT1|nr:hypothetical protein PTTG_06416 [Puccinia triticina 1-1 BBBD Race 1]